MDEIIQQILAQLVSQPLVIAVTGSVAVGKSSFARQLADDLATNNHTVAVVSTDNFLRSNADLQASGMFDQKGFPDSYRLDSLWDMVAQWRQGQAVTIPVYRQEYADIVPGETQQVTTADILIIEGVVALQTPEEIDFGIYLTADLAAIQNWYLNRNIMATVSAIHDTASWRHQYVHLPLDEFVKLAMKVWDQTNQVNLDRYIAPTRAVADVVVNLDWHHQIQSLQPH